MTPGERIDALLAPHPFPDLVRDAFSWAASRSAFLLFEFEELSLSPAGEQIAALLLPALLLAQLASLCADDPEFIDASAELGRRMHRAGTLDLEKLKGTP